jgi:hypothetical protein
MSSFGNSRTTECPQRPEEAAESCYMAASSEKIASEIGARTIPALEFLAHTETCESCRDVFEEVRTFIGAFRTMAIRRRRLVLVYRFIKT